MAVAVCISTQTTPATAPYGVVALASFARGHGVTAEYSNAGFAEGVVVQASQGKASETVEGATAVVRLVARHADQAAGLYGTSAFEASQVDYWLDYGQRTFQDAEKPLDFKSLSATTDVLNHHLTLRSFFVGYAPTAADFALWGWLRGNAIFARNVGTPGIVGRYLARWYAFMATLPQAARGLAEYDAARADNRTKKADQGQFDIPLPGAAMGRVVTRFPPEPSGYLHVGHAKAALLNDYFARLYRGQLIVRFDDTNPSKEKSEFEESIMEDLALIGIKADRVTHTSDYFDQLFAQAQALIAAGKAYVDDTDQETMRAQRMDGIESAARTQTPEEAQKRFLEMAQGTERGLRSCLRAKIDMQHPNKALRDPVMYRCNALPHHRTGATWRVYPTYDFACPVVDSLEGVTHALRTNEYRDRNPQYQWVLDALDLRRVHIWDYSRMNFVYTLLSKRKLQRLVDAKAVSGWSDPRFPTIRGIRRRGMTIEGLRQYILMQGASEKQMLLEWDKIWAINKKVIDPVAARHTALTAAGLVPVALTSGLDRPAPFVEPRPRYKKNPALGDKQTVFGPSLLLEQADAAALEVGEEFTLMDWGNAVVEGIDRDAANAVVAVRARLHLAGDFRATKKKVTWLAAAGPDAAHAPVECVLVDYDYLITKPKLEEDDELEQFLTPVSEFRVSARADWNVRSLKKGDIVQFERKGYYICDVPFSAQFPNEPAVFILVPDGKAAGVASKAATQAS